MVQYSNLDREMEARNHFKNKASSSMEKKSMSDMGADVKIFKMRWFCVMLVVFIGFGLNGLGQNITVGQKDNKQIVQIVNESLQTFHQLTSFRAIIHSPSSSSEIAFKKIISDTGITELNMNTYADGSIQIRNRESLIILYPNDSIAVVRTPSEGSSSVFPPAIIRTLESMQQIMSGDSSTMPPHPDRIMSHLIMPATDTLINGKNCYLIHYKHFVSFSIRDFHVCNNNIIAIDKEWMLPIYYEQSQTNLKDSVTSSGTQIYLQDIEVNPYFPDTYFSLAQSNIPYQVISSQRDLFSNLQVGDSAPLFQFQDVITGDIYSKTNLAGKVVFLQYASHYCPYSPAVQPIIDAFYDKYKTHPDFLCIYVSSDKPETIAEYIQANRQNGSNLYPAAFCSNKTAWSLDFQATPDFKIMDREGNILLIQPNQEGRDENIMEALNKALYRQTNN